MKKKKGFTIIELLATIIILSLLMVVVIGSIAKILDNTTKKYYSSQESLVTLAGKEYFTDYRSKLPKKIANLEKVSLQMLVDKKYIEPVTAKNGTCYPEDSYVYAQKIDENDYQYYTYLSCDDYESKKDSNKPIITFIPNEKTAKSAINVAMRITDNSNGTLFYNYEVKSGETVIRPLDDDEQLYSGDKGIPIGEDVLPDQKKSYQITGYATDPSGNKTVKKSGIYTIDTNEAPVISSFSVNSQSSSYNTKNAKVTFTITDNTNDISYYFSTTGYEKGGSWTTCSASNKKCQYTNSSYSVSSKQDGTSKTFYLVAKDGAGNKVRKKVTYKVYSECTGSNIAYGTKIPTSDCSKKCGTGTRSYKRPATDKYTGSSCPGKDETGSESCVLEKDCCRFTANYLVSETECSTSWNGTCQKTLYLNELSEWDGSLCGTSTRTEACDSSECYTPPSPSCNVPINTKSSSCTGTCTNGSRTITEYYASGCYPSVQTRTETCTNWSTCSTTPTTPTTPTPPSGSAPTCDLDATGGKSRNGWYIDGTVTITLIKHGTVDSYGMNTTKQGGFTNNGMPSTTRSSDSTDTIVGWVRNSYGTNSCKKTINYDKTPPSAPKIISLSPTSCTTGSVTLKVSSSDATSGIDYYEIDLPNGYTTTFSSGGTLTISNKQKGSAVVRAVDRAGNVSSGTRTSSFDIEKSCGGSSSGGSSSSAKTMYTCRYAEPKCDGKTRGWTEWHPSQNINIYGGVYASNTPLSVTCSSGWCKVVGAQRYIKEGCLTSKSGTCCTNTQCPG